MQFTKHALLALTIAATMTISGAQAPPAECEQNDLTSGGTNPFCAICPEGQFGEDNTNIVSIPFPSAPQITCQEWSFAGICGIIPEGDCGLLTFFTGSCVCVPIPSPASASPTAAPSSMTTAVPTGVPTGSTETPTKAPTGSPTLTPETPTKAPTGFPTLTPETPTKAPTGSPTLTPETPTKAPTLTPETPVPTNLPTTTAPVATSIPTSPPTQSESSPAETPLPTTTPPSSSPTMMPSNGTDGALTLASCAATAPTCKGGDGFLACVGKEPKSKRMLQGQHEDARSLMEAKDKCIKFGKSLKKDEILFSCGSCSAGTAPTFPPTSPPVVNPTVAPVGTTPVPNPTDAPVASPTASPTVTNGLDGLTLDQCKSNEPELCDGGDGFNICVEKVPKKRGLRNRAEKPANHKGTRKLKEDAKTECQDFDKTLKKDKILLSCGSCE